MKFLQVTGVKPENIAKIVAAGANLLVAGSTIFGGSKPVAENVYQFEKCLSIQD